MNIKGVKLYKGDFLVVFICLILSFLCFLAFYSGSQQGTKAEVYINGELIKTIKLDESYYDTFSVYGEFESIIEVSGTKVRVLDSECYDEICMKDGYISNVGQILVCMPNKLMIKIVGKQEVDMVVG